MIQTHSTNDSRNLKIRIFISDRSYTSWTFQDPETNIDYSNESVDENFPELMGFNPVRHNLFSKDVFTIDPVAKIVRIEHSPVRLAQTFAGILQLDSNKTYGRTTNKKRLLYKCIPDDKHIPIFLVPYTPKIGFSKVFKNKYVVFRYDQWVDQHPQGILVETLGDVDSLDAFYEYQLYCKSLHCSINEITNKAREVLNQKSNDEYVSQIFKNPQFSITDRKSKYIFTIDPPHSLDFDDGFGIERMDDGKWKVSVYIANVYVWLETLGLWNSFSKRVATIYLPDRRRPMLPTILSEALCSLQEKQLRFAFVMDIIVDENGKENMDSISFHTSIIKVAKNYCYEDPFLVSSDTHYQDLFSLSKKMDRNVVNSNDVVAFWMIQMNKHCARYMVNEKMGIFRSAAFTNKDNRSDIDSSLPEDTQRLIRMWNNMSGQYIPYSEGVILEHELMNIQSYVHITSPIRRLVDLLNQMLMFRKCSLVSAISQDAMNFMDNWMKKLDYLNISMRSIRKIQTDCEILHRCMSRPEIMTEIHTGTVFDKIVKNDGFISYMVYLDKCKILSRITTNQDLTNYSTANFKIYLFEDEERAKKKIRLQIMQKNE